jgi:hypothetical protein
VCPPETDRHLPKATIHGQTRAIVDSLSVTISIREEITIASPPEAVWALLSDRPSSPRASPARCWRRQRTTAEPGDLSCQLTPVPHENQFGSYPQVLILTGRFAMELGRRGVTVNAVAQGRIMTMMARAGRS